MNKYLILALLAGMGMASSVSAQQTGTASGKSGGKAAMCIGCHGIPGYKMAYPHVYHVPLIAGQNARYLELALKAYQTGERKHPTMRSIAVSLSDKDITELATYYGGSAQGVSK